MFKDYGKYLSTSLKMYLFVLMIVFILKLVGLDYFGLDLENPALLKINDFCLKWKLDYIYDFYLCYLTSYITVSLTINEDSKRLHKYLIALFPITLLIKYSGYFINMSLYLILELTYLLMLCVLYIKKINKKTIIEYIKYNILFLIIQLISIIFRNQSFNLKTYNLIITILLNLDYVLFMVLYHKTKFMKGGNVCHHYQEEEVGLFLLTKINLKKSLIKLQENLHNFRKLDKVSKLTFIIYFILSLIWNTLSVIIILLVARLNDTFIECIFILTSFWLSKKIFGKSFHLSSMAQCFIVSNLTYYVLNRVTTPLGISLFVPVMLGVGLSYFTSKLVKKTYKPLYKGMPKEIFEETILKVVDKDSEKYKICYD